MKEVRDWWYGGAVRAVRALPLGVDRTMAIEINSSSPPLSVAVCCHTHHITKSYTYPLMLLDDYEDRISNDLAFF